MQMITISIVVISLLLLAITILFYIRNSSLVHDEKILLCILPSSFCYVASIYVGLISTSPWLHWTSYRLAAASAIANGLNIYSNPSDGPVFGWIYGPVSSYILLPAFLFDSITKQHIAAGIIAAILLLIPFFCLVFFRRDDTSSSSKIANYAAFFFAFTAMLTNDATLCLLQYLPADSASVSFGLLSCYLLIRCKDKIDTKHLFLSALFFNLSIFSKQNEIFIAVAQIIYIWATWNIRTVFRYVGFIILICIIFSLIFIGNFGLYNLIFNMIIIPGHHPWQKINLNQIGQFVIPCSILIFIIILVSYSNFRQAYKGCQGASSFLKKQPWLLLFLVSIIMIPISILGRMKIGGDVNSFHSIYYFIATVALLLTNTETDFKKDKTLWKNWRVILPYIIVMIFCPWQKIYYNSFWPDVSNNQQEELYSFAVKYPGEVYLPWFPMVNLMIDKKLYHYSYGIYDREIAGYEVTKEMFSKYLPSKMKYIIFSSNGSYFEGNPSETTYRSTVMKYFPDYTVRVYSKDLSNQKWIILTKDMNGLSR